MKTIFLPLFAVAFMFTACSDAADAEAGTTAGTSIGSDPVAKQVQALMDLYKKGCQPGIAMADIVKHDTHAEPFEVDGKATGNYESSFADEGIDAQRFYSKKYADATKLDKIRFIINRVYGDDYEGDPIALDVAPSTALIGKALGVEATKGEGGYTDKSTFYWNTDGLVFSLFQGEDYITIYIESAE